jgi:hypothetical protein
VRCDLNALSADEMSRSSLGRDLKPRIVEYIIIKILKEMSFKLLST